MGQISIRMAQAEDRDAILGFIAAHWQTNHIFVEDPTVFDWQYREPDGGYHMALAFDGADVLGILGYIPTGRFDPDLGFSEIMLAIWKVRDNIAPPSLGLGLLKLIERTHKASVIGAIGISDMVVPIYKAFKYTVGSLDHVALIPPPTGDFRIAAEVSRDALFNGDTDRATLTTLDDTPGVAMKARIETLARGSGGLRKSWAYLENRYLSHPWYRYGLATIGQGDTLQAVLVWRRVEVNGAAILRIVDVVGATEAVPQVADQLAQFVQAQGAEYIDLMAGGFDTTPFQAAGFASPAWNTRLILPNYFAPFEARNIEIKFAYKADRPLSLFRADSDQDRPNRVTDLT